LLAQGKLANLQGVMRWGSNYAALVTVRDLEMEVGAVYKPQRGERPLWDFPDGTLCYREVLAYLVSQALTWDLVPPTVLRDGPHGLGSLQMFIEHDPEMNYFSLDDSFVKQLQRFAVFDFLINNADRKGGHLLLDTRGRVWGIDHGLTFHAMPKLRTVIWEFAGQRISEVLLQDIQRLYQQFENCDNPLRMHLDTLLSNTEINALLRRTRQVIECQVFPNLGPGPNYPWPPV
jgi:hypothetical protein